MPYGDLGRSALEGIVWGADPSVPQERFRRRARPKYEKMSFESIPEEKRADFVGSLRKMPAFEDFRRELGDPMEALHFIIEDPDFDYVRAYLSGERPNEHGHWPSDVRETGRPLKNPYKHRTFFKQTLAERFPGIGFDIEQLRGR
tara:strand:- start:32 stop:466 length:435 start_codon:yes stop_codon:yes gene_type:complete